MSPEINQLPSSQIRRIYDKISLIHFDYKKRLDILLEHDGVFENKCESDKYNTELELLDEICNKLDYITDEFFRGLE